MHITRCVGFAMFGLAAASVVSAQSILHVEQDYMSSGFFLSDYLRGEEAGSSRAVNRTTAPTISGVAGETAYFGFGFDPGLFAGPIEGAMFRVEVVANGFFADPSAQSPVEVSLHSLTADPLAVVDQSQASGAGSWIDFRESEVTTSSVVSTSTVDGLGVFEWDITDLVNEWIENGDANVSYTIAASTIVGPQDNVAIGFVNSSYSGLTGEELTARIAVVVPAPGGVCGACIAGIAAASRRRR